MRLTARFGRGKRAGLSVIALAGMAAVAAVFLSAAQAGTQVTIITSLPYTICQSGSYALAGNFTPTNLPVGGSAISICAGVGHVDLEGKGHTISDVNDQDSEGATGISLGDQDGYITVRGFTLNAFGKGIDANNAEYSTISNNELTFNSYSGIELDGGFGNTISGNTATNTTLSGVGFLLDNAASGNAVQNNTATGNTSAGIEISSGVNNTVTANKATGNGTDLVDANIPSCYNGWANNTFATKNEGGADQPAITTYGCIR